MPLAPETSAKERILEAAIDLFSEKGFFETSVRELAERCNLKVSSL
jgi:AcrR family transcriptional regulator